MAALTGCVPGRTGAPASQVRGSPAPSPAVVDPGVLTAPDGAMFAGTTPIDGNRWFPGAVDLGAGSRLLPTDHLVHWLLAAPLATPADGTDPRDAGGRAAWTLWVGGDDAGAVSAFAVGQQAAGAGLDVRTIDVALLGDPGTSPSLVVVGGKWQFTRRAGLAPDAPVRVLGGHEWAVGSDGQVLLDGADQGRTALPDAIPTVARDGRVAVLVDPTDRYDHGVLGDRLEAAAVVGWLEGTYVQAGAGDGGVFEARSALWADLDADGSDDLLLTRSDADVGAQVVALRSRGLDDPVGARLSGQAIGLGGRWRHLVAVAPVGAVPHVVEVVTPHLSRTLQVSRVVGDRLEPTLTVETDLVTHTIGSRDLDRAAVFDADADGDPDLVAPWTRGGLAAHDLLTGDEANHPLGQPPSSNLVVHPVGDGRLVVGIGTPTGIVLHAG